MKEVKEVLNWFEEEITSYINFVVDTENSTKFSNYPRERKIMKATIFLMIYNMLENIIPLALKKVCDTINKKKLKYKDSIKALQLIHIEQKQLQKKSNNNEMRDTINQIFEETLDLYSYDLDLQDPSKLQKQLHTFKRFFSINGTIRTSDLRRELEKKFAIKYPNNQNFKHIDADSSDLLNCRHELSHGIKTFNEIGRAYTIQDIQKIYKSMVSFLYGLIYILDEYIKDEKYLCSNPSSRIKKLKLDLFKNFFYS